VILIFQFNLRERYELNATLLTVQCKGKMVGTLVLGKSIKVKYSILCGDKGLFFLK
jgi:hypothetical protein